jgi:integrase
MTRFDDLPIPADRRPELTFAGTFADLIRAIDGDDTLSATRRRDLKSAIRTFSGKLNLIISEAPASMDYVRKQIDGVHPKQLGIKAKRWQNILSDLRFAINRYGPKPIHRMRTADLPEPWCSLSDLLPAPGLRYGLSRLIKFCALSGIMPGEVDATTIDAFSTWLADHTSSPQPPRKAREAAKSWNKAVETIPDWPGRRVELAPARDAYCLAWDKMPSKFLEDAEAWLTSLSVDSWYDEDAPLRPLKPSSIKTRRFQVRQAFSVLVRLGHEQEQITSLVTLVQPAHVEQILSFFWERGGKQPSSQAAGIAHCLLGIARHRVKLPEADLRKLKRFKQRVTPRQSGLTEKNRATLRLFEDQRNKERLLMFPIEVMERANRMSNRAPVKAALLAQTALAVEILLMMPLRLNNLANLHLDRHLEWRGDRLFIIIPSESVKNDEPIEFELPAESVALLQTYLERFRPTLGNGSGHLFPGTLAERPKNPTHLSRQITKTLFKETGIRITTHQFRHVAAKIWLDDHPGSYEVMRRVLYHRSINTTTANYTGFETRSATLQFDQFILDQRRRFLEFKEDDDDEK